MDFESRFDYMVFKDDQLILRCYECKQNYKKEFNEEMIKGFGSICEFQDGDINQFILLLRKGIQPYEFMDTWKRFDETSLPDEEACYSSLKMEDITDVDYTHAK